MSLENLPTEILGEIILYLEWNDKLKLIGLNFSLRNSMKDIKNWGNQIFLLQSWSDRQTSLFENSFIAQKIKSLSSDRTLDIKRFIQCKKLYLENTKCISTLLCEILGTLTIILNRKNYANLSYWGKRVKDIRYFYYVENIKLEFSTFEFFKRYNDYTLYCYGDTDEYMKMIRNYHYQIEENRIVGYCITKDNEGLYICKHNSFEIIKWNP